MCAICENRKVFDGFNLFNGFLCVETRPRRFAIVLELCGSALEYELYMYIYGGLTNKGRDGGLES